MKLECIITVVDRAMELRFLAMVRSLRAVGCTLPVLAIPYSDNLFNLPSGCEYYRDEKVFQWLGHYPAAAIKRKYCALTLKNYQLVDADVVFLRNPISVLAAQRGFITCCGHWRDTAHIATPDLIRILRAKSSLWQRYLFNSGQFACDEQLYTVDELMRRAETPDFKPTVLEHRFHEQPGVNLLVLTKVAQYSNLTLPPFELESSWAGDYLSFSFQAIHERSPYLMHWAGIPRGSTTPIDHLYLQYLSSTEQEQLARQEKRPRRRWHILETMQRLVRTR